ncbi:MAG: tetratricopeptide repeat protein, partial [Nitrospinaceae bacterium]
PALPERQVQLLRALSPRRWGRSRPLFFFFLIVAGVNVIFFYTWRRESYLPTYIVATVLTAFALHHFLKNPEGPSPPRSPDPAKKSLSPQEEEPSRLGASGGVSLNWRRLAWTVMGLWIPFTIAVQWPRLDLSREYNAETLPQRLFLTLDDRSVFIPGASWFYYWYYQDVFRLRDDVTAVTVVDLLGPDPPALLTSRRYPDLVLPEAGAFDFATEAGIAAYAGAFLKLNGGRRPLLMEHNAWFYEHTLSTRLFQPHRGLLVRYAPETGEGDGLTAWREFIALLEDELNRPGAGREMEWLTFPGFWMESWALFARETRRFELEGAVLKVMMDFLGLPRPEVEWRWVENRLRLGKDDEAKAALERLVASSPDAYATWMARARLARQENRLLDAVSALEEAVRKRPSAFAAHWERALVYRRLGKLKEARSAEKQARLAVSNLREWGLARHGLNPEPSARTMVP